MKKRRLQTGGNINTVPASRQNIEQRTPSGVRPVGSPVIPVKSDVQGTMKHGGELKMKKPKKMAMGGMPGPMPVDRGRGVSRGGGGAGFAGTGRPPQSYVGTAGNLPGGFMGPGAGGMPIGGGMGAMPRGPGSLPSGGIGLTTQPGGGVDQGGYADFLAQRQAARPPGMKKGGKVSASSYNDMTGGAGGGIGRLEKTSIASKTKSQKLKKGGKVKGYADGGELSLGDRLALERAGFDPETRRMKRSDNSLYGVKPVEIRELPAPRKKEASAPTPRPRPKVSPATSVRMDRAETRNETDRANAGIRSQQSSAITKMMDVARRNDNQREMDRLTKLNPAAAAMSKPRPAVPTAPVPRPRPKAADRPSAAEAVVGQGRAEQRAATDRTNAGIRSQQSGAIDKMLDLARRNGNQREIDRLTALKASKGMKKGGKVEAFEGTARDMAEDKKLAKKRGMSLKAWEKSSADEKHDTQQNMKGLKKGGKAEMHDKGCKCMACGGVAKYAMGGKVSTSQTGMKAPLRPKPTAMAKGGAVGKTFGKPLPGTKVSSQKIRSTVSTDGANMKKDGMKGQLRAKASGTKATSMMKPLGMTKMASGGKVRGAGIAQRGTKFIGEV